jgi:ferritin
MVKPEKLSKEVISLLQSVLVDEFKAFYHYRSATNWCKNVGFVKASEFFAKESEEELEHAKGIEDFLVDWNSNPDLPIIEKPEQIEFTGLDQIIDMSYKLEYDLYEKYEVTSVQIFKSGDICAFDFLQKYRTIQKESVTAYSDMINMLSGVDTKSKFEMLMLEKKLF